MYPSTEYLTWSNRNRHAVILHVFITLTFLFTSLLRSGASQFRLSWLLRMPDI